MKRRSRENTEEERKRMLKERKRRKRRQRILERTNRLERLLAELKSGSGKCKLMFTSQENTIFAGIPFLKRRRILKFENRCRRACPNSKRLPWLLGMDNTVEISWNRKSYFQQFSCGVGHVINDVTQRSLASFRLVFLMKVIGISATNAGWITFYSFFVGAIFLGPTAGYLCDKVNIPLLSRKHGKRKSWHLIGTVLAAVSLPLCFSNCLVCSSYPSEWELMVYYLLITTFVVLSLNLIEIAHLSIIPVMAKDQSEAVTLNVLRMAFVFLTGIAVYLVAWAILGQDNRDQLTTESSMDFTVTILIVTGIGLVFAAIFHIGTKEPLHSSAELSTAVVATKFVRKSHFGPDELQTDKQGKEKMRDRFINRLELKDESKKTQATELKVSVTSHTRTDNGGVMFKDVNATNENLSNESKGKNMNGGVMLNSSNESSKYVNSSASNEDENRMSNGQQNSEKDTVRNNQANTETLYKDFEACPSESTRSLGVDNKGYDDNEAKSRPSFPDEIIVTNVEECYKNEEENHGVTSGTLTNSKPFVVSSDPESALPATLGSKTVREWLKDPHLYKIAIIYACTRVLQDVSYSYLPLLLTDRLKFQKEAIANLPLIVLISATVSTVIAKKLVGKIGSKWSFILAALLVIGSCGWFYSITQSTRVLTYPAAALLGFGFSAMFVNAISFATELIGDNKNTSGLVFSFICTTASLIEGTMFITIQNFFPKESVSGVCEECGDYVRHVFSLVPGSLAAISLLIVLMFQASPTTLKRKTLQTDAIENKEGTVETL